MYNVPPVLFLKTVALILVYLVLSHASVQSDKLQKTLLVFVPNIAKLLYPYRLQLCDL